MELETQKTTMKKQLQKRKEAGVVQLGLKGDEEMIDHTDEDQGRDQGHLHAVGIVDQGPGHRLEEGEDQEHLHVDDVADHEADKT